MPLKLKFSREEVPYQLTRLVLALARIGMKPSNPHEDLILNKRCLERAVIQVIEEGRLPSWVRDLVFITNDPYFPEIEDLNGGLVSSGYVDYRSQLPSGYFAVTMKLIDAWEIARAKGGDKKSDVVEGWAKALAVAYEEANIALAS